MSEQATTAEQPEKTEEKKPSAAEQKRQQAETFFAQALAEEEIAQLEKSRFAGTFRSFWPDADPNSKGFLYGISQIGDVTAIKKGKGAQEITSVSGSKFSWLPATVDPQTKQPRPEFLGLSVAQAKNQPLTQQIADDIAAAALARNWKKIDLHGSLEQREMLWLAAMKHGIAVNNFNPSPSLLKQWETFKQENPDAVRQDAAQENDLTPAPAGISGSRFAPENDDNIVDAEWEEVPKISGFLTGPETKNDEPKNDGPKNEGPKDTPDAGGPKRLPPPKGP